MAMQKNCNLKIKRNNMRVFTFSFLVYFLMISFGTFAQTNFSGEWMLNDDKSDFGEGRFRRAASRLTVQQEGINMSIKRVSRGQSGEDFVTEEKFTLDGKECENTTFGDRVRTSVATWSEGGTVLTITSTMVFEREGEQMEMKSSEAWKLVEEGIALEITSTSSSPRGEMKQIYGYDKIK
jgi:hypothetical protein